MSYAHRSKKRSSPMKRLAILLVLLLLPALAFATPYRVVQVHDGDTITVEPAEGGDRIRIRLYGIDCPEKNQPFGSLATTYVRKAVLYKPVDLEIKSKDRYRRTVAVVTLAHGVTLQELLLNMGLAWVYPQYCKDCKFWVGVQNEAQKNRRGLWQDDDPVPPWTWRKQR